MNKSTLSVLSIISFLLTSFQARAEEDQWPRVTISSVVANQYLGFGTGNLLSEDPVVQTGVLVSFKNGIYLDFWNSRSLKGQWNDGSLGNEVDYQIGWRGILAKDLSLRIGVTYFDESKAFTLGAGDVLYTHAYVTKDFKHLSLTAGYENFTTMPESGFQGGNLISLGVSKSQSLCKDRIGLRASVVGVYDTGTLGSGEGFILRGNAGADWNISKRLTFNIVGVNWYIPLTPHDKRTTDAMVYSGFTFRLR